MISLSSLSKFSETFSVEVPSLEITGIPRILCNLIWTLRSLAIKLYKIKENLSNEIMSSIFPPKVDEIQLKNSIWFS